jgi:hypothetical protein
MVKLKTSKTFIKKLRKQIRKKNKDQIEKKITSWNKMTKLKRNQTFKKRVKGKNNILKEKEQILLIKGLN